MRQESKLFGSLGLAGPPLHSIVTVPFLLLNRNSGWNVEERGTVDRKWLWNVMFIVVTTK